jgi:hypothetical protein
MVISHKAAGRQACAASVLITDIAWREAGGQLKSIISRERSYDQ